MLKKGLSDEGQHGVGHDDVAEGLAYEGGGEDKRPVGAHDAEGNRDGRTEDGQESNETHPSAIACHPSLRTLQSAGLHFEPASDGLGTAQQPHAVVEHRPCSVADGGRDEQQKGVHRRGGEQGCHDGLAAERNERTCEKRGKSHAPIAVVNEEFVEGFQSEKLKVKS